MTVLSQSASENIKETLSQLEQKDGYIQLLQNAKSKADSINLALAVNLKGVLSDGIADKDVEIKVDKTVVFINLSDKMLYQSGSSNITSKASRELDDLIAILREFPSYTTHLRAHTDAKGSNSYNDALSLRRADSAKRYLMARGIAGNRIKTSTYGEETPIAKNDNGGQDLPEGRQLNRRVEMKVTQGGSDVGKVEDIYVPTHLQNN